MSQEHFPSVALIVLDGWGERESSEANAIKLARTPHLDDLRKRWPTTLLGASGHDVGLPENVMGNSEVGHLNLGAGRVVYQDLVRISQAIRDETFFTNEAFTTLVRNVRDRNGRLHLLGLVSDGAVHSHDRHLEALLELAAREKLNDVVVHAFTDGRDTPPKSALKYIDSLQKVMALKGHGRIASVSGRFFAMDRDRRWDRIERAYRCLAYGEGPKFSSASVAIEEAYAKGETDEFITPSVMIDEDGQPVARLQTGDACIFFNFRADRARQMSRALADADFDAFEQATRPKIELATFTEYDACFDFPVAFAFPKLSGLFADFVQAAGKSCLRIAETEKYAHVTYFFNGGSEKPWPNEQRILVQSPKVRTYDLQPEMSAVELTDRLSEALLSQDHDVVIANYANVDMVGHTGQLEATIQAVECLDRQMGRLIQACTASQTALFITSDHGNAELMVDSKTGEPHTAHTLNPVPLIAMAPGREELSFSPDGRLADVAPTIIDYMNGEPPQEMTGRSLWLQP